jgi:uncharacterized protein HemX
MARNRKHQSAAIRFGPALKAMVLCLLIGGTGVGYVWQKDQIARLGQEIKQREERLDRLAQENEKKKNQLAAMHSLTFLDRRIKELNLGLAAPQPAQILRLSEPPVVTPAPERARQFAAETERPPPTSNP